MKNILFICSANVGRSQIAEGLYNHFYSTDRAISAAGIQMNAGASYGFKTGVMLWL